MNIITADKIKKIQGKDVAGIMRVYGALYYDALGRSPDASTAPKVRRILNYVLERYNLTQLYILVFCHFEWHGEDGTSQAIFWHLRNNGFPIEWLPKNADKYSAYIAKTITSEVWWDEQKLRPILDHWMKRLFAGKAVDSLQLS